MPSSMASGYPGDYHSCWSLISTRSRLTLVGVCVGVGSLKCRHFCTSTAVESRGCPNECWFPVIGIGIMEDDPPALVSGIWNLVRTVLTQFCHCKDARARVLFPLSFAFSLPFLFATAALLHDAPCAAPTPAVSVSACRWRWRWR